jgi:hypothetical protein
LEITNKRGLSSPLVCRNDRPVHRTGLTLTTAVESEEILQNFDRNETLLRRIISGHLEVQECGEQLFGFQALCLNRHLKLQASE